MANTNRTVPLNSLTPRAIFCIRGRLTYSRLARHIDGDELTRDDQRRIQTGRRPVGRPYTTATICDAQVLYKDPNAAANPALRTIEESYATENLYTSTAANNSGLCYSANNKSRNLPAVFEFNKDTGKYHRVDITGELESGLDVTLVLRVFRNQNNNGISLDQVLVNEPIRYYNNTELDLSQYGVVVEPTMPSSAPVAPVTAQPMAPVATAPVQPVQPAAPAPVAQPTNSGFAAPQPAAPVAPVAPVQPEQPYQAPAPQGASAFGTAYPQQAAAPVQPVQPAAPAPGIQYDPSQDPNRNYNG